MLFWLIPEPLVCWLGGRITITGESNTRVLVQYHPVLRKGISKGVVCLVRDFRWANKGNVVKVSDKTDCLPHISGYTALVA